MQWSLYRACVRAHPPSPLRPPVTKADEVHACCGNVRLTNGSARDILDFKLGNAVQSPCRCPSCHLIRFTVGRDGEASHNRGTVGELPRVMCDRSLLTFTRARVCVCVCVCSGYGTVAVQC